MAVYYDNTSLKAKHERKRSLEELTKENKELKTRLQATEDDLTNTQVALTEVYELLAGGGENGQGICCPHPQGPQDPGGCTRQPA